MPKSSKSTATYTTSTLSYSQSRRNETVENKINTAARMLGMPHQLLAHNDPRLTIDADLGRVFAQNMILEAPVIYIKPGVADFLPGKSESERRDYLGAMYSAATGTSRDTLTQMLSGENDSLQYYDHKSDYVGCMSGINMLCHQMAILLGIDKIKVPWDSGNITFGYYDWRNYRVGKAFANVSNTLKRDIAADGQGWAVGNAIGLMAEIADFIETDNQYIQFYVDANASFGESAGNSTQQSKLSTFTDTLEDYAKEIAMVTNTAGITAPTDEDSNTMMQSTIDSLLDGATGSNGLMNIISMIGNGAKQIIKGGNFQIPEIYSSSSYDKNYSFSVTAATPYGSKLAWYINVGVVICHCLGIALPMQLSANTYKSPYLLKCFSPGWWNCSLGIVDSIGIDKGGDQSWSIHGLPNEIKISISIKDLYSTLSLPNNSDKFLKNSGMMEFLAATCGVDMSDQELNTKFKVWANVIQNSILDKVQAAPYNFAYGIRDFFASKLLVMG